MDLERDGYKQIEVIVSPCYIVINLPCYIMINA